MEIDLGGRTLRYTIPMHRGREVAALQRALAEAGALPGAEVDGIFGPMTRDALRALQARVGLPVTGEVSGSDLRHLFASSGAASSFALRPGSAAQATAFMAPGGMRAFDASAPPPPPHAPGAFEMTGPLRAPEVVAPSALPDASPERIILHWTGGGRRASREERRHYHFLVEQDGTVVPGDYTIADQDSTAGGRYAKHTRMKNTKSVGISLCGMFRASESPFNPGPHPLTEKQVEVAARLAAQICARYDIPVGRTTVLGHGEVQDLLGVAQRHKWDPLALPWRADLSKRETGDMLRALVAGALHPSEEIEDVRRLDLRAGGAVIRGGAAEFDCATWVRVSALVSAYGCRLERVSEDGLSIASGAVSALLPFAFEPGEEGRTDAVDERAYVRLRELVEQFDLGFAFLEAESALELVGRIGGAEEEHAERRFRRVTVERGESLSLIARRELGDQSRWREILELDETPFTPETARRIRPLQQVLIPVDAGRAAEEGAGRPAAPAFRVAGDAIAEAVAAIVHPLNRDAARSATPHLLAACARHGVDDDAQFAYLLATAEHETNFGRAMEEIWRDSAFQLGYEGNPSNEKPGDGKRYKGRGFVQLTFRENYRKFGRALGIPLEDEPERAAEPEVAAEIIAAGMAEIGFRHPRLVLERYGYRDDFEFDRARDIINADRSRFEARYQTTVGAGVGRRARAFYEALNGIA